MGLCCSILFEPKCVNCGCPYYYYNNDVHASRQSCRGHPKAKHVEYTYHEWRSII